MTNSALAEAVDELYATFAAYPLPKYTDPCMHCHSTADEAKLHSKPLRDLGPPELMDYINDALLVWGDANTFKHFLPRILELHINALHCCEDLCDPEILFSKFRHGRWLTWPENEQSSVRNFLHALWAQILENPPPFGSYVDVESWLCSIAQAENDLLHYFEQWEDDARQPACVALSSLLFSSTIALPSSRGRNAFWEGRDAQYEQLKAWAHSSTVKRKLREASERWEGTPEGDQFAAAMDITR